MRERELRASPSAVPIASAGAAAHGDAARARRLTWAELMERVFAIDILECLRRRGPMLVLSPIHPPEAPQAILACAGLPVRVPPPSAGAPRRRSGRPSARRLRTLNRRTVPGLGLDRPARIKRGADMPAG